MSDPQSNPNRIVSPLQPPIYVPPQPFPMVSNQFLHPQPVLVNGIPFYPSRPLMFPLPHPPPNYNYPPPLPSLGFLNKLNI